MSDNMTLEEIEERLDQHFSEGIDALDAIRRHDLTDETSANIALVKTMLQHVWHFDADHGERIHHERRMFRERAWEKKSEMGDGR